MYRTQEKELLLESELKKLKAMKERMVYNRERAGVLLKVRSILVNECLFYQNGFCVVKILEPLRTSVKRLHFALIGRAYLAQSQPLGLIFFWHGNHDNFIMAIIYNENFGTYSRVSELQVDNTRHVCLLFGQGSIRTVQ